MNESKNEKLKTELQALLLKGDFDLIARMNKGKGLIARTLIGMSYDKAELTSWRAIDAIGRLAAEMEPEKLRTFVQRVLWMMREESGNNAWTGAEILGEIVTRNPGANEDIAPIVISFHDELIFRSGCLRALARIASVRPDLTEAFRAVPADYLDDPDPSVRGYAVAAMIALGADTQKDGLQRAVSDKGSFEYYADEELKTVSIAKLAADALGES